MANVVKRHWHYLSLCDQWLSGLQYLASRPMSYPVTAFEGRVLSA